MINVETFDILNSLPSTPEEGEYAVVNQEKKVYKYINGEWIAATMDSGLKVNLYELNKTAVRSLPALTEELINKKKEQVKQFINKNKKFFMLMCKDIGYYTLFKKTGNSSSSNRPYLYNEVFECAMDIGSIHSVVINEDSIEFWIKNEDDVYMFLFFPYDNGVISCQ